MFTRSEIAESKDCLCLASRATARGVTALFDRLLKPHGVRATQFTILAQLMLRGPTPIGALAKHIGTERTTLTRNLAILAGLGWTREDVGETDSRAHVISVTAAGEAKVQESLGAWRAAQQRAVSLLGGAGADALHKTSQAPFRA